ncbi:MAG: hypothetical protein ACLFVI_05160 [Archaeoglobaceae archaeon]
MLEKYNTNYAGWNQDLQVRLKLYLVAILGFIAIFYIITLGI